jgi:hypothetical protein
MGRQAIDPGEIHKSVGENNVVLIEFVRETYKSYRELGFGLNL